jgi:hypothetical protein
VRKSANLLLTVGALTFASLGGASSVLAAETGAAVPAVGHTQSVVSPSDDADNHHYCPPEKSRTATTSPPDTAAPVRCRSDPNVQKAWPLTEPFPIRLLSGPVG